MSLSTIDQETLVRETSDLKLQEQDNSPPEAVQQGGLPHEDVPDVNDQEIVDDRWECKPTWDELIGLIADEVFEAREASGSEPMPLEEHDRHFRAAFDKIREDAASRDDIPVAIASRPVKYLKLVFVPKEYGDRCPCCLDIYDLPFPEKEVRARDGVAEGITKDDLVIGFRDGLYSQPTDKTSRVVPMQYTWTNRLGWYIDECLYVYYEDIDGDCWEQEFCEKLGIDLNARVEDYDDDEEIQETDDHQPNDPNNGEEQAEEKKIETEQQ